MRNFWSGFEKRAEEDSKNKDIAKKILMGAGAGAGGFIGLNAGAAAGTLGAEGFKHGLFTNNYSILDRIYQGALGTVMGGSANAIRAVRNPLKTTKETAHMVGGNLGKHGDKTLAAAGILGALLGARHLASEGAKGGKWLAEGKYKDLLNRKEEKE